MAASATDWPSAVSAMPVTGEVWMLIVAWLARTVRAQALDAEYREEVR